MLLLVSTSQSDTAGVAFALLFGLSLFSKSDVA